MDSAPSSKDVVITILGAAATLAGLVLVFGGVAITAFLAFVGGTSTRVLKPYRTSAKWILMALAANLVSVAFSTVWLVASGPTWMYAWVVAFFFVQLIVVMAVAIYVTRTVIFS